jgi:hypothetical protein
MNRARFLGARLRLLARPPQIALARALSLMGMQAPEEM